MIVSWNWLKQYVALDVSVDELSHRLSMSGLNHESTREVDGDLAIDFEVTSNRPDCLGHIGVAREAAVVLEHDLSMPAVDYPVDAAPVADWTRVDVDCPDLCPRYTARVIRGVAVGPSPDWLRRRLGTCGIASINNVVDVTNYVMLEIGQPLHAFDFDKLSERRILVRRAKAGETLTAINQRAYELNPAMCVIADAARAVAIGGVMGGFDTEIGQVTTNVLIESAVFDPVCIRKTSRALGLSSPSSFRFERGLDAATTDWASRRCCRLVCEVAGGSVLSGVVGPNPPIEPRPSIVLRFEQIRRILGIEIGAETVRHILQRLGLTELRRDSACVEVRPPSWRRDLEREIDLIEEAGRIHGYEHVPEDTSVPMTSTTRSPRERVVAITRSTLVAAGLHEAYSLSFVERAVLERFRPFSAAEPLAVHHPSRRNENQLRQSLVPSLLISRAQNEARGNLDCDLFEIARVYLPGGSELPREPLLTAMASSREIGEMKGVVEALLAQLHVEELTRRDQPRGPRFEVVPIDRPEFAPGRAGELRLADGVLGVLGQLSDRLVAEFELRRPCVVVELFVDALEAAARLIPQFEPISQLPAISRELSLIVDEQTTWAEIESITRLVAGAHLEQVRFLDGYRGQPIATGRKSMHFDMTFRALDRTLTNDEVDRAQQAVIAEATHRLRATVRGA